MQSSYYPRNAQKIARTGKRTPERAKKSKGLQNTAKKSNKTKKKIKTFADPKKNVFISTQLLDENGFFAFFAFFCCFLLTFGLFCPHGHSFACSSDFLGVPPVVARLNPALICCAPAARQ
jgi:hypothetical protein